MKKENIDNTESILNKMDKFIIEHSFHIAGVGKNVENAFFQNYKIPKEAVYHINSYLVNELWGIDVVELSGKDADA